MKPNMPTDEEFETIILALGAYANEKVTHLVVKQYLDGVKNLTDEAAFLEAFSKKNDKAVEEAVMGAAKAIRDSIVVVQAKVIQLRDFGRGLQTTEAIDLLTK